MFNFKPKQLNQVISDLISKFEKARAVSSPAEPVSAQYSSAQEKLRRNGFVRLRSGRLIIRA